MCLDKNKLKILFLGYAVPQDIFNVNVMRDAYPQVQSTKLMWRMIDGIEAATGDFIDLIGVVPASDYPRNKKILFGFTSWSHVMGAKDIVLPFINIIFLKHATRFISSFLILGRWMFINRKYQNKHLIVYVMHSPFLASASLARLFFKFKVTLVVLDLPGFMNIGIKTGLLRRAAKKIDEFLMTLLMRVFDGFIVLTKYTGEKVGPPSSPKLVMEGIVEQNEYFFLSKPSDDAKIVMFSGALVGIDILLDAFEIIQDPRIILYISGKGPMEGKVRDAARNNSRITYLGFLPTEALLERMSEATVFINVRSANTPLIEYSFPSKLLEYMATGRPTISTILPGIPSEYYDYLYLIDNESSQHLAFLIQDICNKSPLELSDFGSKARDFVYSQKNFLRQGERILDFMKYL